jgi:3-deoxy-D-manno-octulosonic-acid transferase
MLYNISIIVYGSIIKLAAIWNKKAKLWINGRKNFWKILPSLDDKKEVVWFHCASMGEYDQALPVMQSYKDQFPNSFLLITFFSPSGYETLKDKSIGDFTCYLPLDTPKNASRFIGYFKPIKAFFVKYEYWLNYIDSCYKNECELYGLSSVFRENQRFFKAYRLRFSRMINKFDYFFLQNEESASILKANGYSNYLLTGDTRYDRVVMRANQNSSNEYFEKWKTDNPILVVGSSWPSDEGLIIPLINQNKINASVILAPHEVNPQHIDQITSSLALPYQLYTDLEEGQEVKQETKVIILNCIGVLANAYKYGDVAYVGGGFKTGLHNILEPAAFGLPVIFGPNHKKFPEAKSFINAGIAKSINNSETCEKALNQFFEDHIISKRVQDFVSQNVGATEKVMSHFKN